MFHDKLIQYFILTRSDISKELRLRFRVGPASYQTAYIDVFLEETAYIRYGTWVTVDPFGNLCALTCSSMVGLMAHIEGPTE